MTAEQYWEEDCELVKYYRKAANIKLEMENQFAWLQGAYINEALVCVAPLFRDHVKKGTKLQPYRDTPYDIFQKEGKPQKEKAEEERVQMEKARNHMMAMMAKVNQRFEKGGEKHD